jgi:hypothetical protein
VTLLAQGQIVFEMDAASWDPSHLQQVYDQQIAGRAL